jgi:hypothetical protein
VAETIFKPGVSRRNAVAVFTPVDNLTESRDQRVRSSTESAAAMPTADTGIRRTHSRTHVILLAADFEIRIIVAATGALQVRPQVQGFPISGEMTLRSLWDGFHALDGTS